MAEVDARTRLIDAIAAVVAAKGYSATTIADIVAQARVSRRTFYEQFDDKQACMLACYSQLADDLLAAAPAPDPDTSDTQALIENAIANILQVLAQRPDLTYTQFIAIHTAGLTVSPVRRDVQDRLAERMRDVAIRASASDPNVKVPSPLLATAMIGGITELIVRSVEVGRVRELGEIAPTVVELVSAVLLSQPVSP